jgi:chromate reductase
MSEILVISGSNRKASVNTILAKNLARISTEQGISARFIDIVNDYPMPLFCQDLENTKPDSVKALKALFVSSSKIIFCTPEHNFSIPTFLKNLIDWISRADPADNGGLVAFKGKVFGILSASPSMFGGLRSQMHLKHILSTMGGVVYPSSINVPNAYSVLNSEIIADVDLNKKINDFVKDFDLFSRKF